MGSDHHSGRTPPGATLSLDYIAGLQLTAAGALSGGAS